ncbi:hypothetical protein HNQ93_001562 [Hymenobacter luteus]|uniref:Uncharacterized protein n=2 Tax=Hymenobacter TaxID=89966 RepID=A0A7W9WBU8_9BACT|nr:MULTISPECIES: Ig-like domain-containing protein [Hymenobacter]MBB4601077.1 hypothetical protein [Hymenobacter latericoloratus]MBB6058716.1 hypothetical protein [Hymenobacter luteus]
MTQRNRSGAHYLPLAAVALSLFTLAPAASHAQGQFPSNLTYSAPITITKGGTYTGNFRSTDSNTPCIKIQTTEPVTITNCVLVGAGDLIDAKNGGSTLVITNNKGYGTKQSVDNRRHGRFVEVNSGRSVRIENNYFEHTSGIAAYKWGGDGSASQTLTVRFNQAKNIDGRFRNGGGEYVQFCGLNQVRNVGNIEVAWNQVVNEPNNSLVEDNINFYNSGGTQQSPARVHNNYVQGAYPYPATANKFTGTGMTTDGDGSSPSTTTAFLNAYENQFISTCNAAMNIAAGHDIKYYNNRMVTSGLLPDGTRLNATYAATSIFNAYQQPGNVFFGNATTNNTIGFVKWGYKVPFADRHDLSSGSCTNCTGTNHLPNPITLQTEQNEWALWQQKLKQNNIVVGADGTNTAAPSPSAPAPLPEAPPTTNTPIVNTPVPTPSEAVFVRAINVNGGAITLDGQNWDAGNASGVQINGIPFANQNVTLNPATDNGRAQMIRSSVYSRNLSANVAVSNGTYLVYAYVWEDNAAQTYSISLEGKVVQSNYNSGSTGRWERLGPFAATVTDGNITFTTSGGDANLSGLEIWRQGATASAPAPTTPAPTTPAPAPANQAPTVSLAANSTVTVNTALVLSATAADTDGSVAKVEFYNGSTKLGEDTSSPYQLSWTPTATGSVSLTARAIDNAGAATTSAAVNVTVNAAQVAATGSTFYRAISLNGGAFTLDGNSWEGSKTSNYSVNGASFANQKVTLNPATDDDRAQMIRSSVYSNNINFTMSNVPNGTYEVYAYVWEDDNAQTVNISLNGQKVLSNFNTGPAGSWKKIGPYAVNVTNGTIQLTSNGGHLNLSGVEVWRKSTSTAFQPVTLPSSGFRPAAGQAPAAAGLRPALVAVLAPGSRQQRVGLRLI